MFAPFTPVHKQAAVLVDDVCSQLPHDTVIWKLSLPCMLQRIACLYQDRRMHGLIQAIRFCLLWQLLRFHQCITSLWFNPVHLVPLAPVAELLEDTLLVLYCIL